jgi:hypothetical protein
MHNLIINVLYATEQSQLFDLSVSLRIMIDDSSPKLDGNSRNVTENFTGNGLNKEPKRCDFEGFDVANFFLFMINLLNVK